jgi:hypothetical protein
MKKFFLIIFILLDGLIIFASGWFLFMRVKTNRNPLQDSPLAQNFGASKPSVVLPPVTPEVSPSAAPLQPAEPAAAVPPSNGNTRKIGFAYRNSKARKVMIRAEFTGWRAEPMQKDPATSTWKYIAVLEPGEYAYCFSVDDKSIRDPANKRTKQVGKTIVSAIIVQPPTAAIN